MGNYNMSFEEAQEYASKRGIDIPLNDGDIFIDEREMTRTVGNIIRWADDTMLEKVEEWLKKKGKGQMIGSLNRFLKEEQL